LATDENPPTNMDRLLSHLKPDSLAAKLVAAYAGATDGDTASAIKKVLSERLTEIEKSHADLEDKKD
jgi:hypothetical protein